MSGHVSQVQDVAKSFAQEYRKTPMQLKVIDCFLVYAVLTAAVQFLYMLCVGSFPFNSFLAGFIGALAFFVLTACLRMQLNPENTEFKHMSSERAFADYALSNALLFLVVWNYIG